MEISYHYDNEKMTGKIVVYDKKNKEISNTYIEKIKENEFKKLFIINKYSNSNDSFKYGYL